MRLDRIIRDSGCVITCGNGSIEISSVVNDSRKVAEGSLFIAVKGFASNGHDYMASVVEKGASAIVYEDQAAVDALMKTSYL